jgi:hypothetical protein
MKTAAWMLLGVLVLASAMESASATVITVNMTGHITGWGFRLPDPLYNQVYPGQPVTASYTYDTATGPFAPAQYSPTLPPAAASVTLGPFTFQAFAPPPPYQGAAVSMYVAAPQSDGSSFYMNYYAHLLQGGAPVAGEEGYMSFLFADPNGQWPVDSNLPTGVPTPSTLAQSTIYVSYGPFGYSNLSIQIDSVTLAPLTLEVSPASGNFSSQQHFDAALFLPIGSQVASAQATVGGNPIANLSYPGACTLVPNTISRTQIVCPNASQALTQAQTTVNWQVTLADGTVINQPVTWNLVP